MTMIKPYAIIEIFKSKGFDYKEAEEIVDFVTESSQDKVLEAIKHLATSTEIKDVETTLSAEIKTLDGRINTLDSRINSLEGRINSLEIDFNNKLTFLETKLSDKIELRIRDAELRLIKWLTGTGIAIDGINIVDPM